MKWRWHWCLGSVFQILKCPWRWRGRKCHRNLQCHRTLCNYRHCENCFFAAYRQDRMAHRKQRLSVLRTLITACFPAILRGVGMNVEPVRGRYCVIIRINSTTLSNTNPDPLSLKFSTARSSSWTIWSVSKSWADDWLYTVTLFYILLRAFWANMPVYLDNAFKKGQVSMN